MSEPNYRFSGKGFVVTGAASGIGRATARRLARLGARVVLWDMDEEALSLLAASLGEAASFQVIDVTDPDAVAKTMEASLDHLGGALSGVVHCAGIMRSGLFPDLDLAEQIKVANINLIGTIIVSHVASQYLKRTNGSLVCMASISGAYGPPEFAAYGASKAGVINFCEALNIELRGYGIHVACINPLFVNTPMVDANPDPRLVKSIGTVHTPDEIAAAITEAIAKRRFMVFPSWRPRLIWALTRQLSFVGPMLMRLNWRQATMAKVLWSRR